MVDMVQTGKTVDIAAIARETQQRLAAIAAAQAALEAAKAEAEAVDWLAATYELKSVAPGAKFTFAQVVAHNQAHKAKGMRRNPISEAIYKETQAILELVGTIKNDEGEVVYSNSYWTKIAFLGGLGADVKLPSRSGETDSE